MKRVIKMNRRGIELLKCALCGDVTENDNDKQMEVPIQISTEFYKKETEMEISIAFKETDLSYRRHLYLCGGCHNLFAEHVMALEIDLNKRRNLHDKEIILQDRLKDKEEPIAPF